MSAARHAEVRAPANEPCPFCGSGGTPLAQLPRRQARRRGRSRYAIPPVPFAELPEWWRAVCRSTFTPHRERTTHEQATLAALDRLKGQAVEIDERDNTIRAA